MRRLSSVILLVVLCISLSAQKSPHGDGFKKSCADCHKTSGWKVVLKTVSFDHKTTSFPLVGQHQAVNCKECHTSLEFAKTRRECNGCHTDIHEQTVGNECARCHTPNSWVVTNITRLHQQSRFPLIGPHATADCKDCHKNLLSASSSSSPTASFLRFDPLGIECYDCHKNAYASATAPNHVQGNYSKNCTDCHNLNSSSWAGAGINHNFFPLTGGHANTDCKTCHTSGSYSKIPADCASCHQPDYNSTTNPSHKTLHFSTICQDCHSLNPGWKPAEYTDHDAASFPIYSGQHKGEWNSCSDCHTNPANYSQFSCTNCHEHNKSDMDNEHKGESGYVYKSDACYACHPTGSKGKGFDHAAANFPLTNGHAAVDCAKCHTSRYAGTSPVCSTCHTNNYNQTVNPNHTAANIPKDCATCHTTIPGWKPATYPPHSNLQGAHVPIANDCATCHKGNYTVLPKACFDCHAANYTQSTSPSHLTAQFPTTCADCHSQTAWKPSIFNHNTVYPLLGAHADIAQNCLQCHANGYPNTPNTCAGCHTNDYNLTTNPNHTTAQFPKTCETCHSQTAWIPSTFNHNTVYPLTGAHAAVAANCNLCHANGYSNTPNACVGCHQADFNQTANPKHTTIGISTDCAVCHTTNPGWEPATFPIHNTYYVLAGAHVTQTCVACHKGNYNTTPNTCAGCHTPDYNQTTNPNHTSALFPKTCADCHSQTAWKPSTWNHDIQYFPIYSGKHQGVWNTCADCHKTASTFAQFTCTDCHEHNQAEMNSKHQEVANYTWTSTACYSCHPKGRN